MSEIYIKHINRQMLEDGSISKTEKDLVYDKDTLRKISIEQAMPLIKILDSIIYHIIQKIMCSIS